jgi:hypothetical protein
VYQRCEFTPSSRDHDRGEPLLVHGAQALRQVLSQFADSATLDLGCAEARGPRERWTRPRTGEESTAAVLQRLEKRLAGRQPTKL